MAIQSPENTEESTRILLPSWLRALRSDSAVRAWLARQRWRRGVACPLCGRSPAAGRARDGVADKVAWCAFCRRSFSVTMNTPMHNTKANLHHWLVAVYVAMARPGGISPRGLYRVLGVRRRTAWYLLARLRLAMGTGTQDSSQAPTERELAGVFRVLLSKPALSLRAVNGEPPPAELDRRWRPPAIGPGDA